MMKKGASKLRTTVTRRGFLRGAAMVGLSTVAAPALFVAYGGTAQTRSGGSTTSSQTGDARIEAARREGTLLVWHGDQEPDVVKFLSQFTQKYGIKAQQQRLLPGAALPKLYAEIKAGTFDADVWMSSDAGIMNQLIKQNLLLQYDSPELAAYSSEHKSRPEGYWTTYYINVGPMMYSPKFVPPDVAPKTWMDLLDPRWKGQIGFQDASAGSQYAWWYLLREVLPSDYFVRLAQNQPRAYNSSTQLLTDILSGDLKIGGKVSIFQYAKAKRSGEAVNLVLPPEGVPANIQVVGIFKSTKRRNAAKVFIDYLLSRDGQQMWNDIQGSYSARRDVTVRDLPPLSTIKVLLPKDMDDYSSKARHDEFVKVWNQVTGLR